MHKKDIVYLLSDSVGETAEFVLKTVANQFVGGDLEIHQNSYVDRESEIEEVIIEAKQTNSIIAYTLVIDSLKDYLDRRANEEQIPAVDLLHPLMNAFITKFNRNPIRDHRLIRKLDKDYFEKAEAVEFSVKYDDARDVKGILKADIVLVGVSRTSKTPLSMYLAYKGYKVANVPLVPEVPAPEELFNVPGNRCVGLVISPEKLNVIRKERLKTLGLKPEANYAQLERILEELEYAERVIKRVGCPIINVSNKAIEETANDIIDILNIKMSV